MFNVLCDLSNVAFRLVSQTFLLVLCSMVLEANVWLTRSCPFHFQTHDGRDRLVPVPQIQELFCRHARSRLNVDRLLL